MKEKYERKYMKLEEMSNLFPDSTGLDIPVWISSKSGREKHNARIKIMNNDGEVSISIYGEPEIKKMKGKIKLSGRQISNIKKFIALNRDTLLNHWNGLIDSKTFGERIKKI